MNSARRVSNRLESMKEKAGSSKRITQGPLAEQFVSNCGSSSAEMLLLAESASGAIGTTTM